MFDAIIRGGLVYDGNGGDPQFADIAVAEGRIAQIGKITSPGKRNIDATGAIVTPGFIDIHTHYDGQFLWDDRLEPSFSHGVTTAIAGNCGVGFAPVQSRYRSELIELMEGIEDIPGVVLNEGLDWDWESFGDYLNRLSARKYSMDVAVSITHAPLRVYVMGERALRHESASNDDIEAMCRIVREAMSEGAIGLSMSRFVEHFSSKGATAPGTFAPREELLALSKAMGTAQHGVVQIITKGGIGAYLSPGLTREQRHGEHELLEEVSRVSGRPVTYGLAHFPSDPQDAPTMARLSADARRRGLNIRPQCIPRGIGSINTLDGFHAFLMKPSYKEIAHLPLTERVKAMREPARRKAILEEASDERDYSDNPLVLASLRGLEAGIGDAFIQESALDCEPGPERRVSVLAAAAGKKPGEYLYDHYAADDGSNCSYGIVMNYVDGDLETMRDVMYNYGVLPGQGDGGAHVRFIADASYPTFMLGFWGRDRTRGKTMPLEFIINSLTGSPAEFYGLNDRGSISVGMRADLNVIDLDRLTLKPVRMVADLPSGGMRMVQGSSGYVATMVAGVLTRFEDAETGERPGRLLRSGQGVQ
jgi:N-acyl-D-amino-acid deacylase